jgi:cation diffusion facilitator family transporter
VTDGTRQSKVTTSGRTVIVALLANLGIAVAKAVAALLTGSAALAAEAAHSVADTANELLLYIGVRHGRRPPDQQHPFGYGQSRYFWALLAAVGIFVVGGLAAIWEGVNSIRHPEPLSSVPIGLAVLAVSAVFEGFSWRTARRELRAEAAGREMDIAEHVWTSSNPTPTTVFLEDSAALIGIGVASTALVIHAVTGSAVADGVASLVIGVVLILVAVLLARRNAALLIDESTPPDVRDRLTDVLDHEPWIERVAELTAVWIGPDEVLVLVHVVPDDSAQVVDGIAALRGKLLALPAVERVEVTPVPD